MENTILVWVDLETTGLNPEVDKILEYAIVLTDLELNVIDSKEDVIPHIKKSYSHLMSDVVAEMHTKNGLVHDIEMVSKEPPFSNDVLNLVDRQLVLMLERRRSPDTIFVIAGSTIGFDRAFLKKYLPKLEAMLHYRQLDVSSYKVGFPDIFSSEGDPAHRAMPDIRESIAKHREMIKIVRYRYPMAKKSEETVDKSV